MAEDFLNDGTTDFSLGQDAWHRPDLIQVKQYASAVNVSSVGGALRPRLPYPQLNLEFEAGTIKNKFGHERSYQDIWATGKCQATIPYQLAPEDYLIMVIAGLIFRTNVRTGKTILLSKDIKVSQYAARINWSYAAGTVVLFDYPDYPVFIKEDEITRANPNHTVDGFPSPEVPISNLGTYNQNRLFVANAGVEFTASDPVGNLATPEAPTTFIEVYNPFSEFVNQFFALPVDEAIYPITAMGFIQELDSNTGIGPMFIATKKKLYLYRTNQPRENWATQGQFGGVLLANAGIVGPRAFTNVNSDLLFLSLSDEGQAQIHALSNARNEAKRWGNISISREVNNYLNYKDPELSQFSVMGYFNNRIFITVNPYRVQALDREQRPVTDYAHGGFVVLEIENLASFLSDGVPVWAGLWTGINPVEFAVVGNKCFVVAKDGNEDKGAVNSIYEISARQTVDVIRKTRRQVRSIVYTRSYSFQGDFQHKKINAISVQFQKLTGKIKLLIEWRPAHSHRWLKYAFWEYNSSVEECEMPEDAILNGITPPEFKPIVFGDPIESGCNPVSDEDYDTFTEVQFRLTIEGDYWELAGIKVKAKPVTLVERQEVDISSGDLPTLQLPTQCLPDWNIPELSVCP